MNVIGVNVEEVRINSFRSDICNISKTSFDLIWFVYDFLIVSIRYLTEEVANYCSMDSDFGSRYYFDMSKWYQIAAVVISKEMEFTNYNN